MPKIFYIGAIVIATSIFSAVIYFLYQDNNNELHVFQEKIENVFLKEEINNQKEIQKIEKEKSNSKIFTYFIIGVFILVIIIGIIIFLLLRCRKKENQEEKKEEEIKKEIEEENKKENEENKEKDPVESAKQAVENFIKIKKENLFNYEIRFIAFFISQKKRLKELGFEEKCMNLAAKPKRSINFLKISALEEIEKFRDKKAKESIEDILFKNFFSTSIDERIQEFFEDKKCKHLLDLILIIILGSFGNLKAIDQAFRDGLLEEQRLNEIGDDFFKLDKENVEKNNDIFLDRIEKDFNNLKEELVFMFSEINDPLYANIKSLIGDEHNYPVNEHIYQKLLRNEKSEICDKFHMVFYVNMKGKDIVRHCTITYFLLQTIELILNYTGSLDNLNKKENIHWRIMIKYIAEALSIFLEYLKK